MNRLTYRDENGWIGVQDQTNGVVSTNSQTINKLAEYEDFMEENEWDSIEDMRETLNACEKKYFEFIQEYEMLKEQMQSIKPKYNLRQVVYAPIANDTILKGEIDAYDYYTKRYFVFFPAEGNPMDMGNEWCCESDLFLTRAKAEQKLKELRGEMK